MIAQRGLVLRAVGGDPVVLGQQALVEDLLEGPPLRLDIVRVHRPVGVVEVDPVTHPVGQLRELADIAGHRGAAQLIELGYAECLDLGLVVDAEFLLDGQLDGQAVAVPAGLAVDASALHRLEAGKDVLEDAGLDVVGARVPVRGRRAFEEGPPLAVLGSLPAAAERVVPLPQLEDLMVHRWQIELRGHGTVAVSRLLHLLVAHEEFPRRKPIKGRTRRSGVRGTTPVGMRSIPTSFAPCGRF